MQPDDIFEQVVDMSENDRVDMMILDEEEYQELCATRDKAIETFRDLNLGRDVNLIVDRMVCCYVDCSAYYGTYSYKRGMLDCVQLLKEMGVIKKD